MAAPSRSGLAGLVPITHRQHGLFTEAQRRAAGISASLLDRRRRSGEIVIVDEGVFRSALDPPSWHQRLLAACLAGPAAASHRSAGALWRLPDLGHDLVEVTALRHRRRKPSDIVWHESYFLDDRDVTEIEAVPVTSATRTVIDLAGVLDDGFLLRVLDETLRRRLTSVERLGRLLERLGPRRPGARRMRQVLELRAGTVSGPVPESDLETVFENLLRRHGLPQPTRQLAVRTDDGRVRRIDYGYAQYELGVELLGAQFHASPERWAADRERLTLLSAIGWQILVFANDDVRRHPDAVARAVRHALTRAGHQFT